MVRRTSHRSDGFTLVEVLVVVTLLAFIATVIAATFTVIVRTNPVNEERADDARSLLNLTRWLPDDVASTYTYPYYVTPEHPNGFTTDGSDPACVNPATLPNGGTSLLNLRWYEWSTAYYVDYVWELTGEVVDGRKQGEIARFTCFEPTSGSVSAAERTRMGPALSELPGDVIPVDVDPIMPTHLNDGTTTIVGGASFRVQVYDDETSSVRDILELVAVSKNVQGPELGSSPGGGGGIPPNQEKPVAFELHVDMHPNTTETFDLPVYDYDGTLDRLVITPPDPAGDCAGWDLEPTVNDPDPQMTITVPLCAALGEHDFEYQLVDRNGGSDALAADPPGKIFVTVKDPLESLDPPSEIPPPPEPPPCEADFLSSGAVVPNPVELKKATGPNPNNEVGHLKVDVVVKISKAGACEPLVLRFVPDPNGSDPTPKIETFDNSTEVEIQKNSYDWRVGDRVLELVELTDPETVRDTVTLVVEPAP